MKDKPVEVVKKPQPTQMERKARHEKLAVLSN
jgi:hypothetical protein